MAKVVLKPSEDAGPGVASEFIRRAKDVKGGFEETETSPTGDAATETRMIPVETAQRDEPVEH